MPMFSCADDFPGLRVSMSDDSKNGIAYAVATRNASNFINVLSATVPRQLTNLEKPFLLADFFLAVAHNSI